MLPGGGPIIIDQQVIERRTTPTFSPTSVSGNPVSVEQLGETDSGLHRRGSLDRMDGHAIVAPHVGHAVHLVDFVPHSVSPQTVLHIQPGQVVRWSETSGFAADLVLVRSELCPPGLFRVGALHPLVDPGPSLPVIRAIVADLRREQHSAAPSEAIMTAAGRFLLQRIAKACGPSAPMTAQDELVQRFRAELEQSFFTTRAVSRYAAAIGASTKTLSRATASLVGCSPKEVIDRRVILEARRLLAHTTSPSSAIGTMLGFSEPTNFTKFFVRNTGVSPQEFRVSVE